MARKARQPNRPRASGSDRQGLAARADRLLPKKSVRRVAAMFLFWLLVLLAPVLVAGGWSGWAPITTWMASTTGAIAALLGVQAQVEGNLIHLGTRSLSVDPACTGAALLAVYSALVLAYPVSRKMKFIALAVGLPTLVLVNFGRLTAVAFLSEMLSGRAFFIVHDYLFEFGMVFSVLIVWAVWLSYAKRSS